MAIEKQTCPRCETVYYLSSTWDTSTYMDEPCDSCKLNDAEEMIEKIMDIFEMNIVSTGKVEANRRETILGTFRLLAKEISDSRSLLTDILDLHEGTCEPMLHWGPNREECGNREECELCRIRKLVRR